MYFKDSSIPTEVYGLCSRFFFQTWVQIRSGVERLVHIQVSFWTKKQSGKKKKTTKLLRSWNQCCWPLQSLEHINICTDSPPLKSLNKQIFSTSQSCNVITLCFPTPSITELWSNLLILKATFWGSHRVFSFKWWFQRTLTQHPPELLVGVLLSYVQHEQQFRRWAPGLHAQEHIAQKAQKCVMWTWGTGREPAGINLTCSHFFYFTLEHPRMWQCTSRWKGTCICFQFSPVLFLPPCPANLPQCKPRESHHKTLSSV